MNNAIDAIVSRIKELQNKNLNSEGSIVFGHVQIGESLHELKDCAHGGFSKLVAKLGYDERVARRYMELSKSWWKGAGLKESGLVNKLPTDLFKLEWLCRLSQEGLKQFVEAEDPRSESRNAVIKRVQEMLGLQPKKSTQKMSSLDRLSNRFGQMMSRLLGELEEHSDELRDDSQRRQSLLKQFKEKFEALEKAVTPPSVAEKDTVASSTGSQRSVEPQKTSPVAPVPSSRPTTTSTRPNLSPTMANMLPKRVPTLAGNRG